MRRFFTSDLKSTVARYSIIKEAKLVRPGIAVSAVERTVDRVTAAKAADEMLTLTGIHTSFVLFPDGERVILSARSSGDVNVQVIVEALGGGGNAQVAGAQISEKTLAQVTAELVDSINSYCDNA